MTRFIVRRWMTTEGPHASLESAEGQIHFTCKGFPEENALARELHAAAYELSPRSKNQVIALNSLLATIRTCGYEKLTLEETHERMLAEIRRWPELWKDEA